MDTEADRTPLVPPSQRPNPTELAQQDRDESASRPAGEAGMATISGSFLTTVSHQSRLQRLTN